MNAYFCVEDPLSKAVILRLVHDILGDIYLTELQPNQGGFGNIRKNLGSYITLARNYPVIILTDLDDGDCAPSLKNEWLTNCGHVGPLPRGLSFHIAIKEVEAWLLADHINLGQFTGIPTHLFPNDPSTIDAKSELIELIRRNGSRDAKSEVLPTGAAKVGLGYNAYLSTFAANHWNFTDAACRSSSLQRCIDRMRALIPY